MISTIMNLYNKYFNSASSNNYPLVFITKPMLLPDKSYVNAHRS